MRIVYTLGLVVLISWGYQVQTQITPDCDLEFASSALGIVQAHINDPMRLAHVEAILFSCNKSRMQKLAEISVFLLEKGTFPSRAMEEIRKLGLLVNEEKKKWLEQFRKRMPTNLGKTVDDVAQILLNNSLSGNEKVMGFTNTVGALPREYRRTLEDVFKQGTIPAQINPVPAEIGVHHNNGATVHVEPEHEATENHANTPAPFPIEKDKDEISQVSELEIPSSTIIRRSDTPPMENSAKPFSPLQQKLQPIKPINQKSSYPGDGLLDATDKSRRESKESTFHLGAFNAPVKPIASFNSDKPSSVGHVHRQADIAQMDDSDLLNPRSSILSDAVRLLEKTIPLIKTGSSPAVAKDFRRLSPFTFSQPDQTRNPLVG
ncbi:unnamed protein product [Strongylus vulgaris]|uniref:Uncharacterized protein n=1 Tax=Strongylus vulgaris TaxID=40348 RepID=A0A3P7KFT4_STRVU|nr:unnamed protein product [Strongylus vulgaris]